MRHAKNMKNHHFCIPRRCEKVRHPSVPPSIFSKLLRFCLTNRQATSGSQNSSITASNAGAKNRTKELLPTPALPCRYKDNGCRGVKLAFKRNGKDVSFARPMRKYCRSSVEILFFKSEVAKYPRRNSRFQKLDTIASTTASTPSSIIRLRLGRNVNFGGLISSEFGSYKKMTMRSYFGR